MKFRTSRVIPYVCGTFLVVVLSGACTAGLKTTNIASDSPMTPVQEESEPFDAASAWVEFETELSLTYPYLDRAGSNGAEAQLARSRKVAVESNDSSEFRRVLHQTALTFTDPHLIVGPFEDGDYNIIFTAADLDIRAEGERFFVADVRADSAADVAGIRPGWELEAIEGIATGEAARLPFGDVLPAPSTAQITYGATIAANGRRGDNERNLTFRIPNGTKVEMKLDSPRLHARDVFESDPIMTDRLGTNDEVGYIRFNNSLGNNLTIAAMDQAVHSLSDTNSLILDLRNTPSGGNTEVGRSIIGHFVTETPAAYQMHVIPRMERDYGVPRRFVEYVEARTPRYRKPVIVLHGRWTGSMGEGIVIGLDATSDALTVGSNMGDLLGALWNINLEISGARMDVPGEALFHPDGTPRENYVADVHLERADRDEDGGDPALSEAMKRLSQLDD